MLTTPDPLMTPTDPQNLNAYAYSRNNPVAFADPTGLAIDAGNGGNGGHISQCTGAGGPYVSSDGCGGGGGGGTGGGGDATMPQLPPTIQDVVDGKRAAAGPEEADEAEKLFLEGLMQSYVDPVSRAPIEEYYCARFGASYCRDATLGELVGLAMMVTPVGLGRKAAWEGGSAILKGLAGKRAAGAAATALPVLPKALSGGAADSYVYFGTRGGKNVYTGITNNLTRRGAQHGDRFDQLVRVTNAPVTRGQARSIEQALIARNPGFENKINSISPKRSYYDDAVNWGEAWLRQNGF